MLQTKTSQCKAFFEIFPGLSELLDLYEQITVLSDRFKAETGIDCPAHCSHCCDTPSVNIEATVFELLPLIIHLHECGKIDSTLKVLQSCNSESRCVFYTPETVCANTGSCSIYPWRGLVCRLFGFMWVMNKNNQLAFAGCKILKKCYNNFIDYESLLRASNNKLYAANFSYQCYSLNTHLASDRYPLHTAILKGIEMFMLRVGYQLQEDSNIKTLP